MTARYISVDAQGQIYEIIDMFDRMSHRTRDPGLAEALVVKLPNDMGFIESDPRECPIYTVH